MDQIVVLTKQKMVLKRETASKSHDAQPRPVLLFIKMFKAVASSGITCGLAFRTSKDTPHDYSELSKHVHKKCLSPGKGPFSAAYRVTPPPPPVGSPLLTSAGWQVFSKTETCLGWILKNWRKCLSLPAFPAGRSRTVN